MKEKEKTAKDEVDLLVFEARRRRRRRRGERGMGVRAWVREKTSDAPSTPLPFPSHSPITPTTPELRHR